MNALLKLAKMVPIQIKECVIMFAWLRTTLEIPNLTEVASLIALFHQINNMQTIQPWNVLQNAPVFQFNFLLMKSPKHAKVLALILIVNISLINLVFQSARMEPFSTLIHMNVFMFALFKPLLILPYLATLQWQNQLVW